MTQFRGKATEYLPFGSVRLFTPPKAEDCGTNQLFCQPTEQGDNITFQFLAAETVNLVADGDFADPTDYNATCGVASWCGQGWGIVDNTIVHTVGSLPILKQLSIFVIGDYYKLTYTITGITANQFISDAFSNVITQNGTYTFYKIWTDANTFLHFSPSMNFAGSISNVSVVKVARSDHYTIKIFDTETGLTIDTVPPDAITGSTGNNVITVDFNWSDDLTVSNGCREIRIFLTGGGAGDPGNLFEDTFDTDQGWVFSGGVGVSLDVLTMCYTDAGAFANHAFINILEVGVEYTVTYDVVNYASGSVRVRLGGTNGIIRTANGTYTETLTCTSIGNLIFFFAPIAGVGNLCIDNIIVSKPNNFDGKSECFDLQTSHDCSFLWVWSNENRWGSYDYSVISGGAIINFQHKLRLICKFRGVKYPSERNIGEDSAGVKSMDYSNMRKTKLLDIDYIPDYLCDAIAAFWQHDTRTINGTSYIMDDEFEPSAPNPSKILYKDLMNATIEIQQISQPNLINRNE